MGAVWKRLPMRPSRRLAEVPEYPFSLWNQRCRAAEASGLDVIRLDIGNPDLAPPPAVVEAACDAIRRSNEHGYPGYRGIDPLRSAICSYYDRRYGVSLDATLQVAVLLGSKEGVLHLQQAVLDPGDIVLVPDPGYTPYGTGAWLSDATVVRFPLAADLGYAPDFDAIPETVLGQARMIWLNYPNNPTGAVAEMETLERAVAFARRHDMLLCHDAAYADVSFGKCRPGSILQVPDADDVAIEFNSLSKAYNMAGWRIGYAVGNAESLALLRRLKTNVDSGMFRPLQYAAIAALESSESWIEERNATYQGRLALLVDALTAAGYHAVAPQATHYLWVRIPNCSKAETFAAGLLGETGVAVAPGTFFGPGGEGFVRLSVTAPNKRVEEAADRLAARRLERSACSDKGRD